MLAISPRTWYSCDVSVLLLLLPTALAARGLWYLHIILGWWLSFCRGFCCFLALQNAGILMGGALTLQSTFSAPVSTAEDELGAVFPSSQCLCLQCSSFYYRGHSHLWLSLSSRLIFNPLNNLTIVNGFPLLEADHCRTKKAIDFCTLTLCPVLLKVSLHLKFSRGFFSD